MRDASPLHCGNNCFTCLLLHSKEQGGKVYYGLFTVVAFANEIFFSFLNIKNLCSQPTCWILLFILNSLCCVIEIVSKLLYCLQIKTVCLLCSFLYILFLVVLVRRWGQSSVLAIFVLFIILTGILFSAIFAIAFRCGSVPLFLVKLHLQWPLTLPGSPAALAQHPAFPFSQWLFNAYFILSKYLQLQSPNSLLANDNLASCFSEKIKASRLDSPYLLTRENLGVPCLSKATPPPTGSYSFTFLGAFRYAVNLHLELTLQMCSALSDLKKKGRGGIGYFVWWVWFFPFTVLTFLSCLVAFSCVLWLLSVY